MGMGTGIETGTGLGWHLPDLGPGGADVLHVLDAADAVVGDLAAGQADVVPKPALPIRAEPTDGACGDRGAAIGGCCAGKPRRPRKPQARARTCSLVPARACMHPHPPCGTGMGTGTCQGLHGRLSPRATVTFKAVAEDLLEDGGKVNELLGGVVDGLCRVFLQQGLHREPGGGTGIKGGRGWAPSTQHPAPSTQRTLGFSNGAKCFWRHWLSSLAVGRGRQAELRAAAR